MGLHHHHHVENDEAVVDLGAIGVAYLTYEGDFLYMPLPYTGDPFSQVYQQIISILQTDPTVLSLIRTGNWIVLDKANPYKRNAQPGDAPELLVEPVTGLDSWASTSTSAEATIVWSIKVATQDMRLYYRDTEGNVSGVLPLRWAIMRALDAAGDNLGGFSFVRSCRIGATVKAPFDPAGNPVSESRGTDGWTLMATLTTVLDLPRKDGVLEDING
jgi:hypothetical protein